MTLSSIIAERLPTRRARPWRKALEAWGEYGSGEKKLQRVPDVSWPSEATIFVYPPGKRSLGTGELLLWELKLFGPSADHGFFLEVILPAMEEATTTTAPRWRHHNTPWGLLDIEAIHVARGGCWEPMARAGKLDLSYRPTPLQWAEGLSFEANEVDDQRVFDRLTWTTPFDLVSKRKEGGTRTRRGKEIPVEQVPTLQTILESLIARMSLFLPGKRNTADDVWDSLDSQEGASLRSAMDVASRIPVHHFDLHAVHPGMPGRWIGRQTFPSIPSSLVPYLQLASILHVGRQTHFGCGTFVVS